MDNMVNHPSHYTQGGIECIDAIESALTGLEGFEAYLTGNILKYIWRWKSKNGVEDLKKARWYLDMLIREVEPSEVAEGPETPAIGRKVEAGNSGGGQGIWIASRDSDRSNEW